MAGAVALMLLGVSGYFKGIGAVASLQWDLTAVAAGATAMFMAWRVLHGHLPGRLVIGVTIVWASFVPPALYAAVSPAADRKLLLLFSATLLCALGPILIDERGLRIWIYGQVVAAAVMAGLLWTNRDSHVGREALRLANDEVGTIASARMLGAGVLVVILVGLHRRKWLIPCGIGAAGGILLMLDVGSRGPVLSFVLVLVVLAGLSRLTRSMRIAAVGLVVGAIYLFFSYVTSSGNAAVQRIGTFITGDTADTTRQYLYRLSGEIIASNPQGLGWGGFGDLPDAGPFRSSDGDAYPHNIFLEVGVEAGWLALIVVVAYCLVCLRRLRDSSVDMAGRIVFALALYWLLVAQTSSDINGNRMTWLALSFGLVGATQLRATRRDASPRPETTSSHRVSDAQQHVDR
jgi:hypothetical protein